VLPRAFLISNLCKGEACLAPTGQTKIIQYDPEQIIIQTQSEANNYLILTDSFYPGWVAYIDGNATNIEPAFDLFRAIAVPAGNHTVEFKYEPLSLKLGALLSMISLVILGGFLITRIKQKSEK
jgi:uncharacterized membrane protein YfhO